jgi:hypothetical protein
MRIDRVASKRLQRQRPLDGNNAHARMSRGNPTYPNGSPNVVGTNQHSKGRLAKLAATKLRRRNV